MKRVFVAIELSDKLKERVLLFQEDYLDLPVRWVPKDNLHITLLPPWEAEELLPLVSLLEQMQGAIEPFDLDFKWVNFGPVALHPRLVWAEAWPSEPLRALEARLQELFGSPAVERPMKPHLTLARFWSGLYPFPVLPPFPHEVSWQERVEAVSLLQSILRPEGAEYRLVAKIALNKG